MRNFPLFFIMLALVSFLGGVALPVSAQTLIGSDQSFGAVPSFAGIGLDGSYYYLPGSSNQSLSQAASSVASSNGPIGTFLTTNICFPDCVVNPFNTSTGGFAAFTNGNASDINYLVPMNQVPTTSFMQTVLTMSGYLAVPVAGTYNFSINSDDGSQLTIGNSIIDTDDGIHGQQAVTNAVTFSVAGLYSIVVNYFQNGGGAGLGLTETDANGSCILGCAAPRGGEQPNDLFYSSTQFDGAPAPEIGRGWPSLALLAILGAGVLVRRRGTAPHG